MPLVTCADLINDAARANGKLGPGRTLSQSEQDDALRIFQRLVDSWSTERLMIYDLARTVFTLIPGQALITIGNVGDWIIARPMRVERMGLILTSVSPAVETPIRLLTDDEWAEKRVKDLTSDLPTECWYGNGWPVADAYFWPIPLAANDVAVYSWQQLTTPTSLESIIRFPPGYEQAFVDALAVATCALFGRRPLPEMMDAARESKARIKRFNHAPLDMQTDAALSAGGGCAGIAQFYSGE